jgi:uncharacterized protein (DUF488 family)
MMTIGHSNRPVDELIAMLQAHGVNLLVDVRTVPKSRYNPQFNTGNLSAPLLRAGIGYLHMPGLGGLRKARKDSINTGWRNDSFRGYADYMQTVEFTDALAALLHAGEGRQTAVMCAEAVPWRCHRSMIADALTARGVSVEHILSAAKREPHRMTSFAHVEGDKVTYPAETLELF